MKPVAFPIAGGIIVPRLWPTVIALFLFAVLIGLGTWQVQRLAWKEALIATIETRRHAAPIDIATIPLDQPPTDLDYRPATATGIFSPDKQLYLSAISLDGQGGYHVLSPLQISTGIWLLIDRGWIPYDRRPKPGEPPTGYSIPSNTQKITGLLRHPHPAGWLAPANQPYTDNWYSFDLPAMAKALDLPALLPVVLATDEAPNPGGYPIGGQTRIDLPNDHLGYAITWYSLAAALLVIYIASSWQRNKLAN